MLAYEKSYRRFLGLVKDVQEHSRSGNVVSTIEKSYFLGIKFKEKMYFRPYSFKDSYAGLVGGYSER